MSSLRWVETLVSKASEQISPDIPSLVMSHCYSEPHVKEPWRISVFPTRAELLTQGADDGARIRVGIEVCITAVSDLFDRPPHIDWVAPVGYDGILDGPHVVFTGRYKRRAVMLEIFDRAPKRHEVVTVYDVEQGTCRPKRGQNARCTNCQS
jgi:hypothetical protein